MGVQANALFCQVPAPAFWPQLLSLPPDAYRLEARVVQGRLSESLLARGDVSLFRDGLRVDSSTLELEVNPNRLIAPGKSVFFDGAVLLTGSDLTLDLDARTGRLVDVEFWISPPWMRSTFSPLTVYSELGFPASTYRDAPSNATEWLQLAQPFPGRGSAGVALHTGPQRIQLEDTRFTTCPVEAESWWLTARTLEIDAETGRGKARNVTLRAAGLPIFFSPYLDFPIDDRRKTGFLYPSLRQSSRTGLGVAAPFYWNQAPNRDLTFTPRFESRRGVLLETESRYLFAPLEGQLDAAYLSGDRLYGDDRYALHWRQRARLHPNLTLDIDAGTVSDGQYFEDFSTTLTERTTRTVERRLDLNYRPTKPFAGAIWQLSGRVQSYQILQDSAEKITEPYQRLPQVRLNIRSVNSAPLAWSLDTEIVHFDRRRGPTGNRLNADLRIFRRVEDWGYFVEPQLRLRHTRYALGNEASIPSSITRSVGSAQIDSGLVLTRGLNADHRQTLEPRLFYGYVPFREQDDIPLFDSDEKPFGIDRLFTLDRFSGSDRIGDTHQITTALTTRIIAETSGLERLSLTGGQLHHLSDRRVRAKPGQPTLPSGSSELFLAGRLALGAGWDAEASVFLEPSGFKRSEQSTALRYRHQRTLMNLGYRFRNQATQQLDFSVYSPLSSRTSFIGRWHFDLDAGDPLDVVAGLEYRSCCYVLRGALNRHRVGGSDQYDNAVLLQLTFSGLGRIDTGLQSLLRDVIPGYE